MLFTALACTPEPVDTGTPEPGFEASFIEGPCVADLPGARCGTVDVPARAGEPALLTLSVAVLPATSGATGTTPFVPFTGGPGASIFDLAGLFYAGGTMEPLNVDHDVVLYSERGTFGATPTLDCPELATVDAIFDANGAALATTVATAWSDCHARLVAEGVDLGAYTNDARAADVPLVLGALGYDAWHVWGVSGGAVLVQRLLRDHPEGVVTAHADSGGFPTAHMHDIPIDLVANVDDRFTRLFTECAADPGCAAVYPTLEDDLWSLVAALEAAPAALEVTHPVTGVTATIHLDGDLFLRVLTNNFAYVGYLPSVVKAGLLGDYTLIEGVLPPAFVYDTGESFADGLYMSVLCTDVGPAAASDVVTEGVAPELVSALLPTVSALLDQCAMWDVPYVPAEGAVQSDVPTLFMEGMYDTNRRPEGGREAALGYTHANVIEFPDRAHVTLDDCAVRLIGQVIDDPDAALNTRCVPDGVTWQ